MEFLTSITVGQVISAFLVCVLIREILFTVSHILPDSIAGPGGWLIDTGPESREGE
ncbi:hypothetical protein [Vannielia litorea]|uniref:Uncharacterized protein n=1 Tax=Vannielia litorea TaxID=1217970 RepID=A0A1N6G1D8_9RHOB|nr:hypothetical protein [Vannielia litorea]SIO01323.1 hypothetical protein SAMN05444002_2125 [Vannielia litorea]